MSNRIFLLLICLGCASAGTAGPTFDYRPLSGTTRYSLASDNSVLVDTPIGLQESGDSTRATIALTVGSAVDGGHRVRATFDALTIWLTGAASGVTEGGALLGQSLDGTLLPTGRIEFESAIEAVGGVFDPQAVLQDFLVPMPGNGDVADPWPINRTSTSHGIFDVQATFEGTGQVIGDTVWNGRPATVIRIDGAVTQKGSGHPQQAPAAIEFEMRGTSTSTYVWDHLTGMMLGAVSTSALRGPLRWSAST